MISEPAMLEWSEAARNETYEAGRQAGIVQAFQRIETILIGLGDEILAARVMSAVRGEDLS